MERQKSHLGKKRKMCDITAVVVQTRLRGIYKGFPTKKLSLSKIKK